HPHSVHWYASCCCFATLRLYGHGPTATSDRARGSDGDGPAGGVEGHAVDAGLAVGRDELEADVVEGVLHREAEPVGQAVGGTGDLDGGELRLARQGAGADRLVGDPLEEVRQLRVRDEALDADLAPRSEERR